MQTELQKNTLYASVDLTKTRSCLFYKTCCCFVFGKQAQVISYKTDSLLIEVFMLAQTNCTLFLLPFKESMS